MYKNLHIWNDRCFGPQQYTNTTITIQQIIGEMNLEANFILELIHHYRTHKQISIRKYVCLLTSII